jgi:[ribosomal protein S5]-alanine N-acetyltransferase
MVIGTTSRLSLEVFSAADAAFIFDLLNSEGWLNNIGQRNIVDIEAANKYISGKLTIGNERGFGCFAVRRVADAATVGLLSLLQRDYLDAPDIGYALLPAYYGQGYAREATIALLDHCRQLGLPKVYAIVVPGNEPSERLLKNLSFQLARELENDGERLICYERQLL